MTKYTRRTFNLGLAGALSAPASAVRAEAPDPQVPPIWGPLRPGRYGSTFEVRWFRDASRPGQDGASGGRALQVSLWRPSRRGAGRPMRVRDYAQDMGAPHPLMPRSWAAGERAQMAISLSPGLPDQGLDVLGGNLVYARAGASAVPGLSKLILLAQGLFFDSPFHQFLLAEYLSSHGYTVAAPALSGALSVLVRLTAADLEAEVRDLEFARAAVSDFENRPWEQFAVVGWDLGGMAALLFAARNPGTRAMAALDSGVLAPQLAARFLQADLSQLRAAMLIGTRPAAELASLGLGEDLTLLRRLDWVDRRIVRVPGMRHADFAIHAMVENVAPHFWGPPRGDPVSQYPRLAETIRHHVDHFLADLPGASQALEAAIASFGGERIPASVPAPPFEILAAHALSGDSDLRSLGRNFSADEASLARLAADLLYRRGRAAAALVVAEIGLAQHPSSEALSSIRQDAVRAGTAR